MNCTPNSRNVAGIRMVTVNKTRSSLPTRFLRPTTRLKDVLLEALCLELPEGSDQSSTGR
jgi:hypothetical protein